MTHARLWSVVGIFFLVSLGLVLTPIGGVNFASAQTSVQSGKLDPTEQFMIGGTSTLYRTPVIDICSYVLISLTHCPISVTLQESYSQNVILIGSPDRQVLQPSEQFTIEEAIQPSSPSVTLSFIFTLGSKSYQWNYPVSTYVPSVGTSTAIDISIPTSLIMGPLGLEILDKLLTFQATVGVSNIIEGTTFSQGITNVPKMMWSNLSAQTDMAEISGASTSANLGMVLQSLQSTQFVLSLSTSLGGHFQLYKNTLSNQTFSSNKVNQFSWFKVQTMSDYGGTASSAWYQSGYVMSLTAHTSTTHRFLDWTVNGQRVSSSEYLTYTVNSPALISAQFGLIQQSTTGTAPSTASIATASFIATAGVVGTIVYLRRRDSL